MTKTYRSVQIAWVQRCGARPIGAVAFLALFVHPEFVLGEVASTEPPKLEEVLVTAQKREERLQDVPMPVTALSADALADNNQLRLVDYYSSVPGLSLTSGGQGDVNLSIRGITTGGAAGFPNPVVGVTVDDVPYGSSTGLGGSNFPDVDPSDLGRIEVLRGPQGTLYGASGIGGVVKFVTVNPSTDGVSGRVQAELNRVYSAAALGYSVRAAVNVPLGDTVAVRASGFTRRDPGYIDDPVLHESGVNQVDVNGGRLSALWRPSDILSLKLGVFLQKTTGDGSSAVPINDSLQPTLGDLKQNFLLGTGGYTEDVRVYSANLDVRLGGTHLVAISGYQSNQFNAVDDVTPFYGLTAEALPQFRVSGAAATYDRPNKKFTQEVRWSSSGRQSLDWLLGLFYNHEDNPVNYVPYAVDPATGQRSGVLFTDPFPTIYAEGAVFADFTWHITERFDLQMGGRESQNKQRYQETVTGPAWAFFGFPSPTIQPSVRTKDSSFTYSMTPEFKLNPDLMIYARLASGYRPGGPNPTSLLFGLPSSFNPDETTNYELGLKGSTLNHLLSFDASVYYINWKDIQLGVSNGSAGFNTNASSAKSEGIELSAQMIPLTGLKISTWVSFNNAVLTGGFPSNASVFGEPGDRLPFSSRFSGSLAVDQEFPLAMGADGFVGGSISYIGNRDDDFTTSPSAIRFVLPSYTKTDLHAGVHYESCRLSLFVNNAADKRGLVGLPTSPFLLANYIQPRTIGLSLSKNF